MVRNLAICLNCDYKWFSKFDSDTLPPLWQCPECYAYSCVLLKRYRKHLKELRELFSPEEAKKILKLYDFAVKNGYIHNTKTREVKFLRLLQGLADTEQTLGADL